MALSLQKFREIVFQLLFSSHFISSKEEVEEGDMVDFMMEQLSVTKKTMREAQEKQRAVLGRLEEIDVLITRFSVSYDFDRIAQVEKGVLRLAIYELCYEETVPPKVVIAEAIRLTRKFATAESAGFVNAVLDAIYQTRFTPALSEKEYEPIAALSSS